MQPFSADESSSTENFTIENQQTAAAKFGEQCHQVPCIIILDSLLSGTPRYQTVGALRDYLAQEFRAKNPHAKVPVFDRNTCRGVYPKVKWCLKKCFWQYFRLKFL